MKNSDRQRKRCGSILGVLVVLAAWSVARAETGEWTDTTVTKSSQSIPWSDATRWADGYVPGGAGREADTATFPTDTLKNGKRPTSGDEMMRRVWMPYGATFTNAVVTGTVYNVLIGYNDSKVKQHSSYAFSDLSGFLGYIDIGYPYDLNLLGSTTVNHLSFGYQPVLNVENEGSTVTVADSYGWGKLYKKGAGNVKMSSWGGEHQRLQLEGPGEVEFAGAASNLDDTSPADAPYIWLDATNTNRMTLVSNGDGTFSVDAWLDCRETATHYAGADGSYLSPLLQKRSDDGRWIVDFLSCSWDAASSARLKLDRAKGVYGAYVVFKSNVEEFVPPLLGHSSGKDFLEDYQETYATTKPKWAPYWTNGAGSFALKLGENRIDGNRMWYYESYYKPGWHVLSVNAASTLNVDYLCYCNGSMQGFGGAKIAEVILYDRQLTADEQRQTTRYLQHKWLRGLADDRGEDWDYGVAHLNSDTTVRVPAGRTARVKTVSTSDGRKLTLVGGGTLETELVNAPTAGTSSKGWPNGTQPGGGIPLPLDISAGTVRIVKTTPKSASASVEALYEAIPKDMSGHYDPSVESSVVETDGKVSLWKNLANEAGGAWYPGTGAAFAPTVKTGGINGLRTIDCRMFTNTKAAVDGYPYFVFNDTSLYVTNIYQALNEVFVVMCQERAGDDWGSFYPVGNTSSRWMSPISGGGLAGGLYWGGSPVEYNESMPQALYAIDGVPLYQGSYKMITDPVVFSVANNVGINLNTFARSQNGSAGGFEYGEIITYSRRLSPSERRAVEAYLLKKWKNLDHPYDRARQVGKTSVAGSGALAVDAGAALSVTGDLEVSADGALEFGVTEAETAAKVDVSGTLSIADGATIKIVSDMVKAPSSGRWTLAKAATLSADVSKLIVEAPAALANGRLKVANGELRYQMKQGLTLVVR